MPQQFRHVDDVRRLYLLGHQMLLVHHRHLHLVCDMENLNLAHQLLVILDVHQKLVNPLLDELVVVALQNLDEQNLDVVLTLVDVRLDEVDVVQVVVALRLHRIQKDCCRHVVVVALLKELMVRKERKELMLQEQPVQPGLQVQQVFHSWL
jgi:hypothetical protein